MKTDEMIETIYKLLKDKLSKEEWKRGVLQTELMGDYIGEFTITLTCVMNADLIENNDESTNYHHTKYLNVCTQISMDLFDKNDHRMIVPYKKMVHQLETKLNRLYEN